VQGYENGFDSIKSIKEFVAAKNPEAHDYDGEYEETKIDDKNAFQAVVIMGNRR